MIRLQYLGTAAAEGIPALFCRCPACLAATDAGGREQRCRSSALVNGHLLLDLSPDLYLQKLRWKLDLAAVDTLVVTHSHSDHLDAQELTRRSTANYCAIPNEAPLAVYGNETVCDLARRALKQEFGSPHDPSFAISSLAVWQTIQVGKLAVTALPALHDSAEDCFVYLLADHEGNTLLYCNDSGLLPCETVDGLRQILAGRRLGLVSMDCTFGQQSHSFQGHMGLTENMQLRALLAKYDCADSSTRYLATHFSHNCGLTHLQLTERFAQDGIEVAYDGLSVAVGS